MSASHVSRSSQPITTKGMGRHFSSPRKARNKKKTLATVSVPVHAFKCQKLLDELASLLAPPPSESGLHVHSDATSPIHHPMEPPELIEPEEIMVDSEEVSPADVTVEYTSIACPTKKSISLCESWHAVIRTMIEPFIKYTTATLGKPLPLLHSPLSSCTWGVSGFLSISVTSCDCSTLPQTLISHGLFPTAPSQPRMAVSVELLSFYRVLFERLCNAINTLAAALSTYYSRRGFRVTNQKCLHAVWLIREAGNKTKEDSEYYFPIPRQSLDVITAFIWVSGRVFGLFPATPASWDEFTTLPPLGDFGLYPKGTTVKDPFQRGLSQAVQWSLSPTPVLISSSNGVRPASAVSCLGHHWIKAVISMLQWMATFITCHRRSAGDSPSFYEPSYFLPKAQRTKSIVPDEAIDQCEASYEAADGQKQKASMDGFDDTGLMALIYTPGEQQKYSVTLIDHLFSLLPPQANVVVLYDVGCVLARSLCRFDIFDQAIMSRLHFATTAMHAYGHEWACQLVYNPRLITGLGLSDGEASMPASGSSINMQRQLVTDCGLISGIGLGAVSRRECANKVPPRKKSLTTGGVSIAELQEQWANQRAAQLSIRAYAPMKLKKELDTVLSLQAELDTTTKVIQVARATIERGNVSPGILDALASMERSHARLITKAEALYSSLNVHEQFPELMNISLDFVQSFISKCARPLRNSQPMLMAAIRKYNAYCEQLSQLYDPSWAIPLPSSLPTKLVDLRNDVSLMEDVWIAPSPGETPRWLEDADMRDGIQALLKREHCLEEQRRLGLEADNIGLMTVRKQRLEAILELQERWPTVLCSPSRYSHQAQVSIQLANAITGASLPPLSWLSPVVVDDHTNSAEDEDMWGVTDLLGPDPPDLSLEPEQIALSDVLGVGRLDDQDDLELEAETLSQVSFKWEIPSDVNLPAITTPIIWTPAGFPRQTFLLNDISILMSPTAEEN
ncbi:hypothetical protein EDC04DRAFT_2925069 [Pisolithus marmoratus]|nr:hypothetical protein EDC04DRAFT_2925069 [Pisolithus marmoratus]